jgi:uncharacterized protein with FMN-binding domain
MRRITLAILSTIAALVLLLSYRTSLGGGAAALSAEQAQVLSGAAATTSGQGPDPAASGETAAPAAGTSDGSGSTGDSAAAGSGEDSAANGSTTSTSSPADPGTAAASSSTAVNGTAEMTRYGAVQVRVTITAGKITDVTAIQYPTAERRDQEINSYAIPQLRSEVIAAQSAQVDVVSGATFTAEGYLASLQSALDAAHFQA